MSKQILDLMKQHKALKARREKAYDKVYAARTTRESQRLAKAADALSTQEYKVMHRISSLAAAESKRLKGKRTRKAKIV